MKQKAFTLLEILLVIAAIGILAAVVIVAINPQRQLDQVRSTTKASDANTLSQAIKQHYLDNGDFPEGVRSEYREVCDTGNDSGEDPIAGDCVDLRVLVPGYIATIPSTDSEEASESGYFIYLNTANNQVGVSAPYGGTFAGVNYENTYFNEGIELYFDAGNDESYPDTGTTLFDLSENNLDATLNNGVSFTDENGGMLSLDGSNDYISGTPPLLATPYSVELVVKTPPSAGSKTILALTNGTNHGMLMEMNGSSRLRYLHRFPYSTGGGNTFNSTNEIPLAQSVVITYVRDTTQKIYINGQFDSEVNATNGGFDANLNGLAIGRLGINTNSRYFNGGVYTVKMYSRALSDEEILHNFEAVKERYGIQ